MMPQFLEITRLWHLKIEDIDDTYIKKPDKYTCFIFNKVFVKTIIENMDNINRDIFMEKSLFATETNCMNDLKTYKIIHHWKLRQKLTPPTIVWFNDSENLFIEDNRNRFNAAYCLGFFEIPVLVSANQLDIAIKKLGLK